LLDWEIPSTATMAATPIAIPSADRVPRSRRVRSPTALSRARSAGRTRLGGRVGTPSRVLIRSVPF
jgi:hypothetical protein